jgi:hypothetical protein
MKKILFVVLALLPLLSIAQQKGDSPLYVLPPFGDEAGTVLHDTVAVKSPLEVEWDDQTLNGVNAHSEKVTAGFYHTAPQAGIYAFYTEVSRGRVLRVRNLNNDSVVFVKVVGALPLRTAFKGCSLGLSNEAKAALDVRDNRAFCEVSYADF